MLRQLLRRAWHYPRPRTVVLMYHRVAEPESDVWDLGVSPAHFEQQLRCLQASGRVLPAPELVARHRQGRLPRRGIVVTFDDGYADNFLVAKPLLERYGLPATFFIPSGFVGQTAEFWWDELEALFLLTPALPPTLALRVGEQLISADFGPEQHLTPALREQHRHWHASHEPPPTRRALAFYQVWERLRPRPHAEQQQHLRQLRAWAGAAAAPRPGHRTITAAELRELAHNPLFTIGGHTATHPALASHPAPVQAWELADGRQALRQATGQPVELLAYPYGNHDATTVAEAGKAGFTAAFTTQGQLVGHHAEPFHLGRMQVNNWDGNEFQRYLNHWLT